MQIVNFQIQQLHNKWKKEKSKVSLSALEELVDLFYASYPRNNSQLFFIFRRNRLKDEIFMRQKEFVEVLPDSSRKLLYYPEEFCDTFVDIIFSGFFSFKSDELKNKEVFSQKHGYDPEDNLYPIIEMRDFISQMKQFVRD